MQQRILISSLFAAALAAGCTITARPPGSPPPFGGPSPAQIQDTLAADEWGRVLHCQVDGGQVRFVTGESEFTAFDFSIVAGERQVVDLTSRSKG
ncbi:MAG: hypothetical protein VW268_09520 [Rhodospirillaceae bacterium]